MRNVMAALIVLSMAARVVEAQTVIGGAGWTSAWDDETNLGKGLLLSGGAAQSLGRHLSLEGELWWARHLRDSGYLAAEGSPVVGTARLVYAFQGPRSRSRAFASAGLGLVYSTGHLTTRTIVPDPGGFPADGPSIRSEWSMTEPAFELGGGVSIRSGDRLAFRPEVRWTATGRDDRPSRSALEPPLWILRAGVTMEWRVRSRT
jgi:hypothetical protein